MQGLLYCRCAGYAWKGFLVVDCENNLGRDEKELQLRQLSDKQNLSPEKEWGWRKPVRHPSLLLGRDLIKAGEGQSVFSLARLCYYNLTIKVALVHLCLNERKSSHQSEIPSVQNIFPPSLDQSDSISLTCLAGGFCFLNSIFNDALCNFLCVTDIKINVTDIKITLLSYAWNSGEKGK